MGRRKPVRCGKCKEVLSEDGRMIPLVCPNCGEDGDEVDRSWIHSDPDDIDAPRTLGGTRHYLYFIICLFPERYRAAILIGLLILMASFLLWALVLR